MKVAGHVEMTRDAVLITAGDCGARNDAALAELRTAGVNVDPGVFLERRLAALAELLLDDDGRAALELLYQEALERFLASDDVDAARAAARQAMLLAPASAFGDAAQRRG